MAVRGQIEVEGCVGMSSECRCHTDENFCFYCEMYTSLEKKHEQQTVAINKVVAYLEDQKRVELDDHNYSTAQAFEIAAKKLKEVLSNAPSDSRDPSKPE